MNKTSNGEPEDLRLRTKRFALSIIRAYTKLPKSDELRIIGRQFLRSGTSVGAHYREACRARSNAEFISKLEGALQELDETAYWIEILVESRLCHCPDAPGLLQEIDELIRILVRMVKNAKGL
jgi:four helix bundle protein